MADIITFLGKSISHFLCRKNIIEKQEAEIYQYGFEIIISTMIGLAITLLAGVFLKMFFLSILYYLVFVTVRQFTGGYHADSYLNCNLAFLAVTFFTLGMTKLCAVEGIYTITLHGLISAAALLSIWVYAPVENPNKLFLGGS